METTETTTGAAGRPLAPERLLGAGGKRRMQANAHELQTNKYGYHAKEHDEDVTCHKTHEGDTPCLPVEAPNEGSERRAPARSLD